MPVKHYDESGFDLTKGNTLGYENYFLLGDPFPAFTITDEEPEIFVDRVDLMNALQKFILAVYKSGDSDAFLVIGDWGDGKTHILKYLKKGINGAFANLADNRAIAVYVRPGGSFLDFVSSFVGSLGLAFLSQTVDEYLKQLPDFSAQAVNNPQPPLFGSSLSSAKDKSSNLDRAREAMESDLLQEIGSTDLLSALVAIAQRTDRITAWSWLKGLPITAQDRKRMNIAASLKEGNALDVLTGLVRFLHRASYKMVYILFDELEEISELKDETRRDIYLNYLRQFIDDNQQGVALIFGATPSGWDEVGKVAEPLERRIIQERVYRLSNFGSDDTLSLVQKYLERGHDRYFESTGTDSNEMRQKILQRYGDQTDPTLFPYSRVAITKVLELARYKVGYVLKGLKMLMKAGYIEGQYFETEDAVTAVIPTGDTLEAGV